jgi:hypothetical protein
MLYRYQVLAFEIPDTLNFRKVFSSKFPLEELEDNVIVWADARLWLSSVSDIKLFFFF